MKRNEMKKSIFRINRELDCNRHNTTIKIMKACKSKYPKNDNDKTLNIMNLLRHYEDYIFKLSKLNIEE